VLRPALRGCASIQTWRGNMKFSSINPWRNTMEKMKTELATLAARSTKLDTQRAAAQTALDRAVEARDQHKLAGDLDNVAIEGKLQAAVDTATSALSGFAGPMTILAKSIADIEKKIADEHHNVNKKIANEKLAAQVDVIEQQLAPFLKSTRDLAVSTAAVSVANFETDQIAGYLRNAASEIETAVTASVANLRSVAAGILTGQHPIPRPPQVAGAAKAAPPAPTTTTTRLFLTLPVGWFDENGGRHRAASMHDVDLPNGLVAKAKRDGAAHSMDSTLRAKNHGSKTSAPPDWNHVKWLNDDPRLKSTVEPIMRSSPFEDHPNVGKPWSQIVPTQPVGAMRNMKGDRP
jgi:hypothetical protein